MATNHDQLMKELIATFPEQFLRLAAPDLAERVEIEDVVFEPEEHYAGSPSGYPRRGDLLGPARARPDPDEGNEEGEEVMLHVEIELRYRGRVEPRLLQYNRALSLKYEKPVHTVALFLRGGPAGPCVVVYEERSLGRVVTALSYHSFGLSRAEAAEYLARPEPLAWALAALMRPAKGQPRSKLGILCLHRIAAEPGLRRQEQRLLLSCVFAYADFEDEDALEFDRITSELETEEVQDVRMTMTERWRREGLAKGHEEGLAQGREQGLEQGLEQSRETVRGLVLRLLGQRFGGLPQEVQRRVAAIASVEELSRLAEKVYQVESLDELGLA